MSEHLNEMLVKERGRYYYVLPVNINKKVMLKTKDESEFVRKHYAKEILDCLFEFFDICLKENKRFIVQTKRIKNEEAITALRLSIKNPDLNKELVRIFANYLKPMDFHKDTCSKDGTHAFIFEIKDYKKRIFGTISSKREQRSLYIKFSFIYDYKLDDATEKYRIVGKNNYGQLVIQPRYLVLNTISVHETKEMKSDYTRYLKWLEGN